MVKTDAANKFKPSVITVYLPVWEKIIKPTKVMDSLTIKETLSLQVDNDNDNDNESFSWVTKHKMYATL